MKEILLPAETWEEYSDMINCLALSQQKGNEVVSVKAFEHSGYLHMPHAGMHCNYSTDRSSTLYTYRLLPEDLMEGETTVWHDEKAITAGLRDRGDHSGLIVSVRGTRMVCAFPVLFIKGLPSQACRVSIADAMAHDKSNRKWGWRSHYQGNEPTWMSLSGHPVVRYSNGGNEIHVVLWRQGKDIEEMAVAPSSKFGNPQEFLEISKTGHEPQMALF